MLLVLRTNVLSEVVCLDKEALIQPELELSVGNVKDVVVSSPLILQDWQRCFPARDQLGAISYL